MCEPRCKKGLGLHRGYIGIMEKKMEAAMF